MSCIHLVYSNSRLPLSPLIRWQTGAMYSHVGLILEPESDKITHNSLITHSALSCKGVKFTTLKNFIAHASNYRITQLEEKISLLQFNKAIEIAKNYEGTGYDLKGAIGLGIGENWQEDDVFWCSEWVAFILKLIGMELPYLENEHRITPKHNMDWPQHIIY